MDPEEISAALATSPTADDPSTNLESVLTKHVADLEQHRAFLEKLCATGRSIEYFIGWFTDSNSGAFFHWELLRRLAALRISLSLDVYGGPETPPKI
jgi:hypothetical protein